MIPIMYRSSDTSAPVLSNAVGTLVGVLDACLVTGYATQTLTTVTHSGGIISVAKVAHGYIVGQVISVSGGVPEEYNGRVTVLTVPDADHFTYAPSLSNPASSPATGTVKGNTSTTPAALGWQLVATATNIRLYRPRFGTRRYLAVDDNNAVYSATVRAFESASAASISVTGTTNPFPTLQQHATGVFWQKTNNVASTPNWIVLGDDKGFFYQGEISAPLTAGPIPNTNYFGDFTSYVPGDTCNCILIGKPVLIGTGNSHAFGRLLLSININPGANGLLSVAQNGKFLNRAFHQGGGSFQCETMAAGGYLNSGTSGAGTAGGTVFEFPYRVNGGLFVTRMTIAEPPPNNIIRGHLRGVWAVCHDITQMQTLYMAQQMAASDGINNMTLEVRREQIGTGAGAVAFELGKEWQ